MDEGGNMKKISREFLAENELIFVGYSGRNQSFSKSIYKGFMDNGITVYPMNTKSGANYEVKVYQNFDDLPKIPQTAFVLVNKNNAEKAVKELAEKGVKKIFFQSKRSINEAVIDVCNESGIELAVGCPMMLFGRGLHRFHGFISGVKK